MAWIRPPLDEKITEHFAWVEAVCRHCRCVPSLEVVIETAEWLEQVRHALGDRVIHCNSWARCETHNRNIGGAPHSYHIRGMAVDITVRGLTPAETHRILRTIQGPGKLVGGLGRYASFCHADRGPARRWNGP